MGSFQFYSFLSPRSLLDVHTHTHIYIYVYISCMCVFVSGSVFRLADTGLFGRCLEVVIISLASLIRTRWRVCERLT